ncbi:hypothetical protein HanPI659440_Chr12g0464821 [Helianthus annuus]|nr:hypothetical protein HanPI659440_Chr12g0464821 [Helianthus annuus]
MAPVIFRGRGRGRRGKGTDIAHNDHEAGPSNTRAPSSTRSEEPQRRRNLFEPARHSTSHSSTPSYRHSFGPDFENDPNNPQPSYMPLQRSVSHRAFDDPTPYFRSQFNPADYIQEPAGFVPLGPQDHFSEDHMDEDTDPIEPARRTPTHPIEISDGSSFHGTPYQGPDSFQALYNQHEWYFTPSHQTSQHEQQQQQDPSEDPRFVAVTPPPPPPVQPVMADPPRRRRSGARMSTRGGEFHFSTPRHSSSSHYPPLQEEGPSSPVQEANSAPVAPSSPPFGYDHPIPAYTGPTAYNPFEPSSHAHYNYNYERDPYVVAARYNARYPDGAFGNMGIPDYSAHGYPAPPRPPVPQPAPQPRFSPPEQEEILHRLTRVERDFEEERKNNRGFLKGLANLLKGKKKKRDH